MAIRCYSLCGLFSTGQNTYPSMHSVQLRHGDKRRPSALSFHEVLHSPTQHHHVGQATQWQCQGQLAGKLDMDRLEWTKQFHHALIPLTVICLRSKVLKQTKVQQDFSYADTSSTMSHSLVTSTFNCEDKSRCICRLLLKSSRLCSMASTRRSCIGETSDRRSTNTAVAPFGMWAISFPRSKTCLRLGPNHIDLWFNDPKARSKWLTISANLFEILQMAHWLRMSTNEHRQPLDAAAMKRSELAFQWL